MRTAARQLTWLQSGFAPDFDTGEACGHRPALSAAIGLGTSRRLGEAVTVCWLGEETSGPVRDSGGRDQVFRAVRADLRAEVGRGYSFLAQARGTEKRMSRLAVPPELSAAASSRARSQSTFASSSRLTVLAASWTTGHFR